MAVQIQPLRIAVVEDEPFLKDMLVRHLRSAGRHRRLDCVRDPPARHPNRVQSARPRHHGPWSRRRARRGRRQKRSWQLPGSCGSLDWLSSGLCPPRSRWPDLRRCVLRKDMDFEELDRVIDGIAGLRGARTGPRRDPLGIAADSRSGPRTTNGRAEKACEREAERDERPEAR